MEQFKNFENQPVQPVALIPPVPMPNRPKVEPKYLNKKSLVIVIITALVFVLLMWNFWSYQLKALGLNMFVFLSLLFAFFGSLAKQKKIELKQTLVWIIPLALMAFSYAIFKNPFSNAISIFIFFVAGLLFSAQSMYGSEKGKYWGFGYLANLFLANILLIEKITRPFRSLVTERLIPKSAKGKTFLRVLTGVILFLVIGLLVIIPLLSSVDNNFKMLFEDILEFLKNILSLESLGKIIFFFFLFTFLGALGAHWLEQENIEPKKTDTKIDSLINGIVVGGIFLLYLIFIILQIQYLWNDTLPVQFEETETLVKSGFWQLFVLTILNILIFLAHHGRAIHRYLNFILIAFVFSSLLLVVSAAHRVLIYAYYYGLSYEKFFASYTVIFCSGVFVWFIGLIVFRKKANILKGLMLAALWVYAFSTILPIEKIIFQTNLALTQNEESRININEMKMLRFDALPTVEKNFTVLVREAKKDHAARLEERPAFDLHYLNKDVKEEWVNWISDRREEGGKLKRYRYDRDIKDKKWYEKTFREIFYTSYLTDKLLQLPSEKVWKDTISNYKLKYPADYSVYYANYNQEFLLQKPSSDNRNSFGSVETVLKIRVYDRNAIYHGSSLNEDQKSLKSFLERVKEKDSFYINLAGLGDLPVYIIIGRMSKDTDYVVYGLVFESSTQVFRIYGVEESLSEKFSTNPGKVEYLQKVSSDGEVRKVIDSLELVK